MPQTVVKDADAGAARPQRATQGRAKDRGDVTGNQMLQQKEDAAAQRALEAAEQDAAIQAEQSQRRNTVTVIDYTGADTVLADPEPEPGEELSPTVTFVAKAGAEEMTYGIELNRDGTVRHGRPRIFNFQEGQRYEVPRDLYEHMDSRGLVWH